MGYRDLLTQRAKLEKSTVTRSVTGDEVETWVTKFVNVPVLVTFVTPKSDTPLGLAEAVTHMIHMEVNDDVKTGRWRAVVDGREYRIVDVRDPGSRGHHFEMLVRRMA